MDRIEEISDTSIIDLTHLTKDELEKDFNNLKKKYANVQDEIESKTQIIYDLKRQLNTAALLEKEYQHEIENLQAGNSSECNKLASKVQSLEDEIKLLKENHQVQIQLMDEDLNKKNEEIAELEDKLKVALDLSYLDNKNEYEQVLLENTKLKSDLIALYEELDKKDINYEDICKQYKALETSVEVSCYYFIRYI